MLATDGIDQAKLQRLPAGVGSSIRQFPHPRRLHVSAGGNHADELFVHSRHPYTRGLLASIPRVDTAGLALTPIPGAPPSMMHPPSGCAFHPRCPEAREVCSVDVPVLRAIDGGHCSACLFAEELSEVSR